jgi:hypothetical protein
MSTIDDGVIKYNISGFTKTECLDARLYREIESWRKKLFNMELIGEYKPEMIGYGNLSQKTKSNPLEFIISGTQTGKYEDLTGEHYALVTGYDLEKETLTVVGPIMASSEALTHAAIYEISPEINFVFHCHCKKIWRGMLDNNYPATDASIPYGTKQMALEAKRIMGQGRKSGLFAMAGHEDGIISFSDNPEEAFALINEVYKRFR